jgi:hypothetical protein
MKLPSSRWPVLLLMALLVGGAVLLIVAYPPAADRYHLPFTTIDCGPLPSYVPADFLQDVRQLGSFPETLDTRQPQLLEKLHAAFRKHPRVLDVKQVRLASSQKIVVELRFREPVALVQGEQKWIVDAHGVLLPPLPGSAEGNLIPIEGVKECAIVPPGQPWPAVQAAATVAAAVRHDRDTLRIAAVALSNDPLQPTVQLRTTGGSIILWRNLRAEDMDDSAEKLRLLLDYVTRYGSLDVPEGPYRFDVRTPAQGLLRQQMVP